MNDFVLSLSDRAAHDPDQAGSKGAALARITTARLPVPGGFVITTSAFRSVSESLGDELALLDESGSTSENALKSASAHARHAILGTAFPRGAISQIRSAWKDLRSPAVSVRSSSTAEDLADSSFAGQYDSYLNVTSFNELLEKVRFVWASLHSPHAIGYRRRNGMSHADAYMAVVVQTQLRPVASGVMFTRDPITGKCQFVVSVARGLGEGVVAGTVESDRFVLRPRAGTLVSSEISTKKVQVVTSRDGGIQTVSVAPRDQKKPAVTSRQLTQLAGFGRRLTKLFRGPQDIEFAVENNKLQILQSRPMTAIEKEARPDVPWNKGINRKYTWQRRGGPYYRLEQDTAVERLKHMKTCYDETGSSMTANHVGHVTNGCLYVRPNEVSERALKKRHQLQTRRINASLRKGKSYFEDVLQRIVEERLNKLRKTKRRIGSFSDQVDYLEHSVKTMGYVQGNLHWRQVKPGEQRSNWHKEFSEITGEPEHNANVFLQAIPNRMTMLIKRIVELAQIAQSDAELRRIFLDKEFDELHSPDISKRKQAKQFNKRFKAMMRVYGQRSAHGYGTSAGFATPTWNIDHTLPFEFIAVYVEQDLKALHRHEKRTLAERLRSTSRVRRKLARNPKKLDRFNAALDEAELGVRFLEDHNYYMEQCTVGTMREAIFDTGQALVKRGQIEYADDVFHFSIAELKRIARKKTLDDLRSFVKERSEEWERRRRMKPPTTLGKKPKKIRTRPGDEPLAGLDGNVIRGASASSGRVTARAVVALPKREHPRVHPGDILVAPNVGPDWTPIFATIGGLVLDSGSLSQHAALVAREYQIPSVMQTKEASRLIKDGQIITVDGDAGTIELNQNPG
ncbi:MAG: PEP/pyruvate-binding domain-containing protein [Candidatus Latescibacterota bacterium]|nr:PEP/pyruvate-binding domain-containing protein [Candidatus Latescibacterota bacterium]